MFFAWQTSSSSVTPRRPMTIANRWPSVRCSSPATRQYKRAAGTTSRADRKDTPASSNELPRGRQTAAETSPLPPMYRPRSSQCTQHPCHGNPPRDICSRRSICFCTSLLPPIARLAGNLGCILVVIQYAVSQGVNPVLGRNRRLGWISVAQEQIEKHRIFLSASDSPANRDPTVVRTYWSPRRATRGHSQTEKMVARECWIHDYPTD